MNEPLMSGCASHRYVYVAFPIETLSKVDVPVSSSPVRTLVPMRWKLWSVAVSWIMKLYVPAGTCVTVLPPQGSVVQRAMLPSAVM